MALSRDQELLDRWERRESAVLRLVPFLTLALSTFLAVSVGGTSASWMYETLGFTAVEATARLFISEATVKTHLLRVYAKLGVKDRASAVAAAFERGLLGG